MLFGDDRNELRNFYFQAWKKYREQRPLEAIEQQIATVVSEHPEYINTIENPDKFQDKDYDERSGEANPYLHLGLHLAIRDQIQTNLPAGIQPLYAKLNTQYTSHLDLEHAIMPILFEEIYAMQHNKTEFSAENYLEKIRGLLQT